MIESHYWRVELKNDLAWLRKHQKYRRWSEKQLVLFERKLILVAFQVRSLLDHLKVNDQARCACMPVLRFRKVGERPFTRLGPGWPEDRFDMEYPEKSNLPVVAVCNQLIHHYWMQTASEQQRFYSMLVFSDYSRNKWAYELKITDLLALFGIFADDSSAVASIQCQWDQKKQDYVVVQASGSGGHTAYQANAGDAVPAPLVFGVRDRTKD
ncbi:MAG: hypothetical protein KA072_13115 [Thermoanaerobaculaceae bacterium]|nr:hypothetical protein [Thermoanaerobaculaceae bacterium]